MEVELRGLPQQRLQALRVIQSRHLNKNTSCALALNFLNSVSISFNEASVLHSNLGNHGPDVHAPPTILLSNIGRYNGERIDLEARCPGACTRTRRAQHAR